MRCFGLLLYSERKESIVVPTLAFAHQTALRRIDCPLKLPLFLICSKGFRVLMFGRKKQAAESAGRARKSLVGSSSGSKRRLDNNKTAPVLSSKGSLLKGILKFTSNQESLSATYGGDRSESGGETPEGEGSRRGISFHKIEIREYERTLGDNPSCSSGPPIA